MIYLWTKPVGTADHITAFSSSNKAILPDSFSGNEFGQRFCAYPCPTPPDTWCLASKPFSEVSSWELMYTPPAQLRPGLWNLIVTAKKKAFGGVVPDPIGCPPPLYNAYILLCYNFGCGDSGAWWVGTCDYPESMEQISAAGDGSDASDLPDHNWNDVPMTPPTGCCGALGTVLRFTCGPTGVVGDNQLAPVALWSWELSVSGTWQSDFAP